MSLRRIILLVVEDNEDDFFMLERSFKIAAVDAELRWVKDGQEAIDYFQGVGAFHDRTAFPLPSLVLLDLKLPMKHGFDVLEWTRQQTLLKGLPIIIFTSSNEEADVCRAYDLGANAFLVKPSSADKLVDIMRGLDFFWIQHNRFRR